MQYSRRSLVQDGQVLNLESCASFRDAPNKFGTVRLDRLRNQPNGYRATVWFVLATQIKGLLCWGFNRLMDFGVYSN